MFVATAIFVSFFPNIDGFTVTYRKAEDMSHTVQGLDQKTTHDTYSISALLGQARQDGNENILVPSSSNLSNKAVKLV